MDRKATRKARTPKEKDNVDAYYEFMHTPAKTLKDFLIKYLAEEEEDREYVRLNGRSDGIVDYGHLRAARIKALDLINQRRNDPNDNDLRQLARRIEKFFEAIGVDSSVFKVGKNYEMSGTLEVLFEHALYHRAHMIKSIRQKKYREVHIKEYEELDFLIRDALRESSHSDEEKRTELEKFHAKLRENGVPTDFHPHCVKLDHILALTWEGIKKEAWFPQSQKYDNSSEDISWDWVSEYVYQQLKAENNLYLGTSFGGLVSELFLK